MVQPIRLLAQFELHAVSKLLPLQSPDQEVYIHASSMLSPMQCSYWVSCRANVELHEMPRLDPCRVPVWPTWGPLAVWCKGCMWAHMKKSFFVQDRIAPCIDFAHHNSSEFCFVGVYLSAVALQLTLKRRWAREAMCHRKKSTRSTSMPQIVATNAYPPHHVLRFHPDFVPPRQLYKNLLSAAFCLL